MKNIGCPIRISYEREDAIISAKASGCNRVGKWQRVIGRTARPVTGAIGDQNDVAAFTQRGEIRT